jgi:predicted DNA-binding transcriptional regulator YafY
MAGVDPKIWKAVTWFEGQKIKTKEDGSVTMTFDAADIISATRFVLEWGGEAKALKPRALVAGVRECIAALAGAHGMLVE